MSNSDDATLIEIISLVVTCLVPFLLGFLGWALNEVYQNLKSELRECNRLLDAYRTRLIGIEHNQREFKQRIDSTRGILHKIEQKTGDTKDVKDRVNVIGRKVNLMDNSMKSQQESHGRIIIVLKEVVAKLQTFKQK